MRDLIEMQDHDFLKANAPWVLRDIESELTRLVKKTVRYLSDMEFCKRIDLMNGGRK